MTRLRKITSGLKKGRDAVFAALRSALRRDGRRRNGRTGSELGVEVVSSAELIQEFEACLNAAQFAIPYGSGRRVDQVRAGAFRWIGERLNHGVDELTVKLGPRAISARPGCYRQRTDCRRERARRRTRTTNPCRETNVPIRPGRLGAARHVGEARPARSHLLRHHLDRISADNRRTGFRTSSKSSATPATPPSKSCRSAVAAGAKSVALKWTTPPAPTFRQRVRGPVRASHGPLDRRGSPWHRRQYG